MNQRTRDPSEINERIQALAAEDDAEARERERQHRLKAEAGIENLLGKRGLFKVPEAQEFGGPSPSVVYRAARCGMIELTRVGGNTRISRSEMKRILIDGLGRVPFSYENGTHPSEENAA